MKAFLATCIAGAVIFAGMIYLVGGSTPGATVPDAARRSQARSRRSVLSLSRLPMRKRL